MTVQEAIAVIELRRNEIQRKYEAAEALSQRYYFSGMVNGLNEALAVVRQALEEK